ncbi:hypothetical protein K435DRAFT_879159 [Dendrothele bispora CBS 962.96]|uniref:Uncharacterized protein n=1 Tax=Dendrothele bispora (strain CBS 962.96) TaxID=1314807 RepID=A0A4S8KLW9_DENBC|nr:hypothetical protein K435DRAFT_879159 [Dendrothele bispora CBS 962.96]
MPEAGVIAFFAREIHYKGNVSGKSKLSADHPDEFGTFTFHPDCLANLSGNRQSISFHSPSLHDPTFLPLPKIQGEHSAPICSTCPIPSEPPKDDQGSLLQYSQRILEGYDSSGLNNCTAAHIINTLGIKGRIFCCIRGKELVIGIGEFAIRICFGTEGHTFWIPTPQYRTIVSQKTVKRGEKGKAYEVPHEFVHGPRRSSPLLVSIQAAFVRPDWTLLFVDHQCFITFHIFRLRQRCTGEDFEVESLLWKRVWSRHHGPVYSTQPQLTLSVLDEFRKRICDQPFVDYTPIWQVMKDRQDTFNGFGAQEACDALFAAHIHTRMPVTFVCKNNDLWNRLHATVIEHHRSRVERVSATPKLPYVSKEMAFSMNTKGQNMYAPQVQCYRRKKVHVSQKWLDDAWAMGLLDPNAVLGVDGIAKVHSDAASSNNPHNFPLAPHTVRGKTVGLQNYIHKTPKNKSSGTWVNMYSPFICQCPEDWLYSLEVYNNEISYTECINETTLGPYSFKVFVDTTWSQEHLECRDTDLVGRPALKRHGKGVYKRPKVADIPSGVSHKSSIRNLRQMEYGSEQPETGNEGSVMVDKQYEGGRVTRSRTRQNEKRN